MIPSKYKINVAKVVSPTQAGWFCTVDAGIHCEHAKRVAAEIQKAFPAPEYHVTLHQYYDCTKPVDEFDWSVEV